MPKDLVGQLRGWQETATKLDKKLNVPLEVDPKVVAAKEKALKEARKRTVRGRVSRSQQRKQDFLAREREKVRMQALEEWGKLPVAERQKQLTSGFQTIGSAWARLFGYGQ